MTEKLRTVALIQQKIDLNVQTNLAHTAQLIEKAVKQSAELIVLPELHARPYFCQTEQTQFFDWAEPIPGPTTEFFSKLAKQHNVVIVCSIFEERAPGLCHNTAVVLERNGTIAGLYRKMHIPEDPGYQEKFYFTPGDLGFHPISTSVGRLGVLVCWDQWYPEAARLMALRGAELLLYPTAIGWDPKDGETEQHRQRDSWITIQRAHAIANGIPVLSCNRVGFEPHPSQPDYGSQFWGSSFVAGPQGELLSEASIREEEVLVCTLSLTRTHHVRRIWPFLRDRRIDAYDDLLKRFCDK